MQIQACHKYSGRLEENNYWLEASRLDQTLNFVLFGLAAYFYLRHKIHEVVQELCSKHGGLF
jgi:hypothetical protein